MSTKKISTVEELQEMDDDLTADYVLTDDIDADGYDFTPVGLEAELGDVYQFFGTLDGQDYTIRNLTIDTTDIGDGDWMCGMFSRFGGDYIRNITLENIEIVSNSWAGVFAPQITLEDGEEGKPITFENITIEDLHIDGGGQTGGIMGSFEDATLTATDCHIENSVVEGGYGTGSLFGQIQWCGLDEIADCSVSDVEVRSDDTCGILIGNINIDSFNSTTPIHDITIEESTIIGEGGETISGFATYVEGGAGSDIEGPFTISDIIMSDITMESSSSGNGASGFSRNCGNYDDDPRIEFEDIEIENLNINDLSGDLAAGFSTDLYSPTENISISGDLESSYEVAGFTVFGPDIPDVTTMENCSFEGTINAGGRAVGFATYCGEGNVENCSASAEVNGVGEGGGFCGSGDSGIVEDCHFSGQVLISDAAENIAGFALNDGDFFRCSTNSYVEAIHTSPDNDFAVSGFANYASAEQCYADVEVVVEGGEEVAGFATHPSSTTDCYVQGTVTFTDPHTGENSTPAYGGGCLTGEITNVYSAVEADINDDVERIVGFGGSLADGSGGNYWDEDLSGISNDGYAPDEMTATPLPTEEMTGDSPENAMSEFDFVDIWWLNDSYPELRNLRSSSSIIVEDGAGFVSPSGDSRIIFHNSPGVTKNKTFINKDEWIEITSDSIVMEEPDTSE